MSESLNKFLACNRPENGGGSSGAHGRFHFLAWCAAAWFSIWPVPELSAQTGEQPVAETASPVDQKALIPGLEISARAGMARTLAREAEVKARPDSRLTEIENSHAAFQEEIQDILAEADWLLAESGSTLMLVESEKSVQRAMDRLKRLTRDLSSRSSGRQSALNSLQAERALWEATAASKQADDLPPVLKAQVADSIELLTAAEHDLRSSRDEVLSLEADLARQLAALESSLIRLHREISGRSASVFKLDSPPIWQAFSGLGSRPRDLFKQMWELSTRQGEAFKHYLAEQGPTLVIWLILWCLLSAVMMFSRDRLMTWSDRDPVLGRAVTWFERPLAAAAVVILVTINLVELQAPAAWGQLLSLLLLLCVVYLLLAILPRRMARILYLLIPAFFLFHLVNLVPLGSMTQRFSIVALALISVSFCLALLADLRDSTSVWPASSRPFLIRGIQLLLSLYALGLVCSFAGNMALGALLVLGSSSAIFTAIVFWVVALQFRLLARIALVSDAAHRLGVAPLHSEPVRRRLFHGIAFFAVVMWTLLTLRGFGLLEPLTAQVAALLSASLSAGEISLSLGRILLFAFLIWLTFKLAALTGFVVGDLILPKLRLPQGAPHAISRLMRYTVIFVGVLFSIGALGFNLSQAAIIAGGLGVGIGFGLQNIVSNFAAGLILLFERPIRQGDMIEMGAIGGVVEKIGMRATLVRTWRGSELVVPNSQLLSSEVVNWTLVHDRRRIEISVSVAYESDPDRVAGLLVETARHHPDVDERPEPVCLFMGFGDSGLDFQLRAWSEAAKCINLESELRFEIFRTFKEAGIKIPFPQRDLHLRSVTAEGLNTIPPA